MCADSVGNMHFLMGFYMFGLGLKWLGQWQPTIGKCMLPLIATLVHSVAYICSQMQLRGDSVLATG